MKMSKICKITGAGAAAAGIPRTRSAPRPGRRDGTRLASSPLSRLISRSPRSCLILAPGTFTRDRPGPGQPRKTKKAIPGPPTRRA